MLIEVRDPSGENSLFCLGIDFLKLENDKNFENLTQWINHEMAKRGYNLVLTQEQVAEMMKKKIRKSAGLISVKLPKSCLHPRY